MRLLQQRVAQLCNREDNQTGTLWQSRFRSVLLLDIALQLEAISNVAMVVIATQRAAGLCSPRCSVIIAV
jgi:hypothetical protein